MSVLEKIAQAGIVGCGGAGFPTDLKLRGSIEHLIINGAECEPGLQTDKYIMRHFAPELVWAASELCGQLGIPRCTIALKREYEQELRALREAVENSGGCKIRLHTLDSFYPAGDEQTLVYEVTGRIVPPGGIPIAVGAVVDNIATLLAVFDALHGRPFTQKYLTVTGEVARPVILRAPLGTSFSDCLALAGGALPEKYMVIRGGPMMGAYMTAEEASRQVVTKTTSAFIVLEDRGQSRQIPVRSMLRRAQSACIQCTSCTQLCPRHSLGHPLEPHRIMRRISVAADISALLDEPVIRSAQLCCECGVCETIACPMGLQPRRINAMLKKELAKAGIRFAARTEAFSADPEREYRKIPTLRAAMRTGVHKYAHLHIDDFIQAQPESVTVPLGQHIGPPAVPVIAQDSPVKEGQLIAQRQSEGRGAAIHAGVNGTVTRVSEESITIERR